MPSGWRLAETLACDPCLGCLFGPAGFRRPGWDLAPAQWGLTAGSRRRRPRRCKPAACSVAAPRHSSGPSCPSHRAVGEFRSGGHDPRPGLLVVWTLSTGRAGAKSFVCHLTDPQTCQGMPAALVLVRGGGRGPRVQWRCSKRSALVARLRSAGLHAGARRPSTRSRPDLAVPPPQGWTTSSQSVAWTTLGTSTGSSRTTEMSGTCRSSWRTCWNWSAPGCSPCSGSGRGRRARVAGSDCGCRHWPGSGAGVLGCWRVADESRSLADLTSLWTGRPCLFGGGLKGRVGGTGCA